MPHEISRSTQAKRDLEEQIDYLKSHSDDAAHRFLDAAEHTFAFLAKNQGAGQLCRFQGPQATGIRAWPVDGFRNHLVFYRPTAEGVDIVRVLHGARDIEAHFN